MKKSWKFIDQNYLEKNPNNQSDINRQLRTITLQLLYRLAILVFKYFIKDPIITIMGLNHDQQVMIFQVSAVYVILKQSKF